MIYRTTMNYNSSYPQRWQRNKVMLFCCLEMVEFAGEGSDIEILENGKTDREIIKAAAYRLETAAHSKLLEFEGSSIDINEKSKKPKSTKVTGLGARIKDYKKRIWEAKGTEGKFSSGDVSIIALDEVKELEEQHKHGTPDDHRNVMSYFNR